MNKPLLLDANAILRFLLDDNHAQYLQVREKITNDDCFTIPSVIQEAVYVLNGFYNVPREKIRDTFSAFFDIVQINEKDILIRALQIFTEKPKLDFVDCVLCGYAECRNVSVFTFDEKLIK